MDTLVSTKYKKGDLVTFKITNYGESIIYDGVITKIIPQTPNPPLYEVVSLYLSYERLSEFTDTYNKYSFNHMLLKEKDITATNYEDAFYYEMFLCKYEEMLPFLVEFIHILRLKKYLSHKPLIIKGR